jgi:Protein of unknown function (DUF4235)
MLGLAVAVLAGTVASAVFKKLWQFTTGEEKAPQATDADRGWPEILPAGALNGAIFAVVKAAIDRRTAESAPNLAGSWPGDGGS